MYYNDTHIVYKNEVRGKSKEGQLSSPISRGDDFKISFECSYKRSGIYSMGVTGHALSCVIPVLVGRLPKCLFSPNKINPVQHEN